MAEHLCNTCFYRAFDEKDFPCVACENYDSYVNYMAYHPADIIAIKTRDNEDAFDGYYGGSEDYVQKANDAVHSPKHYMLFEKEGIEVRDVIAKLVDKMYASYETPKNMPMALSDYVQMMQYLMRFMDKNGKEDLEKARWYLDKLIDSYGSDA